MTVSESVAHGVFALATMILVIVATIVSHVMVRHVRVPAHSKASICVCEGQWLGPV